MDQHTQAQQAMWFGSTNCCVPWDMSAELCIGAKCCLLGSNWVPSDSTLQLFVYCVQGRVCVKKRAGVFFVTASSGICYCVLLLLCTNVCVCAGHTTRGSRICYVFLSLSGAVFGAMRMGLLGGVVLSSVLQAWGVGGMDLLAWCVKQHGVRSCGIACAQRHSTHRACCIVDGHLCISIASGSQQSFLMVCLLGATASLPCCACKLLRVDLERCCTVVLITGSAFGQGQLPPIAACLCSLELACLADGATHVGFTGLTGSDLLHFFPYMVCFGLPSWLFPLMQIHAVMLQWLCCGYT